MLRVDKSQDTRTGDGQVTLTTTWRVTDCAATGDAFLTFRQYVTVATDAAKHGCITVSRILYAIAVELDSANVSQYVEWHGQNYHSLISALHYTWREVELGAYSDNVTRYCDDLYQFLWYAIHAERSLELVENE